MSDITTLQVVTGDITNITVSDGDISVLNVQNGDITTLIGAPATINVGGSLQLSNNPPLDIQRTSGVGVSQFVSREDHVHSAADLLVDGGNY